MLKNDTIAAISTGMTNSGIGIVRISGEEAIQIADRIYKGKQSLLSADSHTIHYGHIVNGEEVVDQVLVMLMKGPKTYTGEDTVEINCHGGTFVVQKVLETVVMHGARPAEPGEFTKRAFLNGKMDLSQAEAVIDVIHSESEYALKSSISQLKGSVKHKIQEIREVILYHTAFIETALDDPEHISVDGYGDQLQIIIEELLLKLKGLIDSSDQGRILKEGIQTVIVGKPNAGKSSLLNVLSGKERAIVTNIEGTTRDILEEKILLHGLCLNVIDTAGIRQTDDLIEQIGVEKARQYANEADLIVYVVDSSRPLDTNDFDILDMIIDRKSVILLNKTDLEVVITKEILQKEILKRTTKEIPMIEISAKKEKGIDDFDRLLHEMFLSGSISFNNEVYITNIRQKDALNQAYESLKKVLVSIEIGMPEDFYSIDLMDAYESLGSITGETIGEDLVNEIFSKFCMGK